MNSITYGSISNVVSEITTDISNDSGKHNTFLVVTNSENHYPNKQDPVILRYDQYALEWIFVADRTINDFGYLKETIDISDNEVFLTKIPLDGVIWDVFILDSKGDVIKFLNPKDLFLEANLLLGLDKYFGYTVSLMYAFGTIESDGTIIKVDLPKDTTYLNQEVYTIVYDDPYDMNDILTGFIPPETNSYFDTVILERIKEMQTAIELLNTRKLYTIERTLIENNMIKLPYNAIGTIVHDSALIYLNNDINDRIIMLEVTCTVNNNNNNVIFDIEDDLNGYYAVVTYLAELGTINV